MIQRETLFFHNVIGTVSHDFFIKVSLNSEKLAANSLCYISCHLKYKMGLSLTVIICLELVQERCKTFILQLQIEVS